MTGGLMGKLGVAISHALGNCKSLPLKGKAKHQKKKKMTKCLWIVFLMPHSKSYQLYVEFILFYFLVLGQSHPFSYWVLEGSDHSLCYLCGWRWRQKFLNSSIFEIF